MHSNYFQVFRLSGLRSAAIFATTSQNLDTDVASGRKITTKKDSGPCGPLCLESVCRLLLIHGEGHQELHDVVETAVGIVTWLVWEVVVEEVVGITELNLFLYFAQIPCEDL